MAPEDRLPEAAPPFVLSVVGLSHKTAPVDLRERLAFPPAELPSALSALRDLPQMAESLLLSTCNRTEVYAVTRGEPPVDRILECLCGLRDVSPQMLNGAVYVHRDDRAVRHALRVAVGLDSMVLGEAQILGQMRRAFEDARAARNTGPVLNRLAQAAIVTGRRVRRETGLNRYSPSIAREALALGRHMLGALESRRVAVVGAGKIAGMAVEAFASAGARIDLVANRTVSAAAVLAAPFGATAAGLEAISGAAASVDLLIVCTAASRPVVDAGMLARTADRTHPLMVIDLGVPRGVEAAVAHLPGVSLHNLDALSGDGARTRIPAADLARAEEIVEAALGHFETWVRARAAAPIIAALRTRAASIVDDELARSRRRLRGLGLGCDQHDAVRAVVDAAIRRLLHGPIVHLRDAAARQDAGTLDAALDLFDLRDDRTSPGGSS